MLSGPRLGPVALCLLPMGAPVEPLAWPLSRLLPGEAQASAPLFAHQPQCPQGPGSGRGHRGASWPPGSLGGAGHTHSPRPDVPDPQRSFLGPTGLSSSQAHQRRGHSGGACGVPGSACCVSPGQGVGSGPGGGTSLVQERGRCVLGEGLVPVPSSPILHPEFLHTSGAALIPGGEPA